MNNSKVIPGLAPSVADLTQEIVCRPPSRLREDDQIVELFLNVYRDARFAHGPKWLPQSHRNVEVIARDAKGTRLAIEHTRLFAFEGHKEQEELLRPIAECLEAEPGLQHLNKRFELLVRPNFLGKLPRTSRSVVREELSRWAIQTFPALEVGIYEFQVRIPLAKGRASEITLHVDVSMHVPPARPVYVGGCLPADGRRLLPIIRKALADKLEKLVDAEADQHILLFELRTLDSERRIIDGIRSLAHEFPLFQRVDHTVVAKTFGYRSDRVVYFYVWDVAAANWSDYLKAVISDG